MLALGLVAISAAGSKVKDISVALVDATKNADAVSGTPATAAPGSVVALKVAANLQSATWLSTRYSIGGGHQVRHRPRLRRRHRARVHRGRHAP